MIQYFSVLVGKGEVINLSLVLVGRVYQSWPVWGDICAAAQILWTVCSSHTKICSLSTLRKYFLLQFGCIKSVLGRVRNCVGKQALCCEMVALSYISLTIAMQISCLVYTVILHVPLWLQVCCTVSDQSYPTKEIPYRIIHRLVVTVFIKSCPCTAFVWYLLHAVTPLSQNISSILTHRSYILSLIHVWLYNGSQMEVMVLEVMARNVGLDYLS